MQWSIDTPTLTVKLALAFVLALFATHAWSDSCETNAGKLQSLERSGLTGTDLVRALEDVGNLDSCRQWQSLMGDALAGTGNWRDARKAYKRALSPTDPESFALLAKADLAYANTKSSQKVRNNFLSQASANANLANGLYKNKRRSPPDWLVDLILELNSSTRGASAEYYAQALATSTSVVSNAKSLGGFFIPKSGYKGAGVEPGIDVQILFELNKDSLTADGQRQIRELGGAIREYQRINPSTAYSIIGHTDIQGDAQYNLDLSLRRAQTVSSALRSELPSVNFKYQGVGESQPKLDVNSSMSSRRIELIHQANRRVEVKLQY